MKRKVHDFLKGIALVIFLLTCQATQAQTFVHPGIAFNQADLNQLKANITQEPWLSNYNSFKNSTQSQLSYGMKGPYVSVTRSPDLNNGAWKSDMVAVRNLALMYVFTGDSAYARKATNMLDAWAVTNISWGGNESMLDIGDYAPYWGVGAEILRYTFPGWTAANTQHVEKYFANVLFPTSFVPGQLRDQNKGAIQLKIALAASIFCNDRTRFNQSVEVYRMDAGGGMRNSLPNGETGDTGRDDHWEVQAEALVWGAEVAWKQRVDMFSELDNRVLAIAELYHKYAFDGATMTYIPFGGYASYWTNWGIQPGKRPPGMTNIIYNAYNRRKGIPTPNTDRMRAALGGAGGDFLYLKSSDTSTAVSLPPVYYPADHVQAVNSGLTNIDIGNPGQAGSSSFNNGIWTLKAAGTSASNAFSFNFKKVSGDAGLVVKVNSVSPLSGGCGVMLRESLAPGARYWEIFLGANGGAGRHWQPIAPWWLKIERVGIRIFTYHSQDGVNWTNTACVYSATGFPTELYAGFYTMSANTSVLNTATFSGVAYSQTAPTGSPEISSATTATATIGVPFTYSINASASPSSYSASGLPAGLSLNAATGVISGTPTGLGQSEVTLTATNTSGSGTATLILNVLNNQAPAAITSAVASVVNTTQITLSWPASANATSYSVKRSLTAGGPYTTIQAGITLNSFTDPSPAYEVNNYYVITALTGDMESANSNEVFASIPPAIPGHLVATNQSDRINLTWDAANDASSYHVKRGTASGGPYTTIATVGTNSYTDTNVTSGSPYYYVVSSVGTTKESANSLEVFGSPGANSAVWSPTPLTDSLNLAANWTGNILPANPAILTFGSTTDSLLTNDLTGLVASRIQFASDANSYTISGNGLTLKNDLVNNSLTTQTFTTPLLLTDTLNVNTASGGLVLNGPISGTGSLKTKSGSLYINGSNSTYSGNTTIASGGIVASGIGTGTPSNPTAGPFGTGKILLNGGQLRSSSSNAELKLYNDIEVLPGNRSTFYEDAAPISLYGKLLGSGSVANDAKGTAGLYLFGDNSGFTGTFTSLYKNQLVNFVVPESGSANANWLLDANGVDNHRLSFKTGTISFGSLSGRGYIRTAATNSPVISIGALNTTTSFGGTFDALGGNLTVEKVGTGTWGVWGNHAYGGTTTVKKGKFYLSNNPTLGVFYSPVIVLEGAFGGTGKSTASATIGTGSGPGAVLEPGNDGIGTLTIGALTLKADATYTAELNLGTAVGDKVTATNVTLLNSPKLTLIPIAGELPSGTSYTIVNNTGTLPISGTFKDLPEMSLISTGGYDFRITYKGGTGNDVVLLDDRTKGVTITSTSADTALQGKAYNYTITAIKSPTSFSASGLPAGLTVNTTTGVISGVPAQSGSFPVTLTASNGSTADTAKLSLTIQSNIVGNIQVSVGDAQTILSWDLIANSNYTYHVKRSTASGGPYTTIGTTNTNTSSFMDVDVNNGTTYFYVIASVDSLTENPNSQEISVTPLTTKYSYWPFDEASGTAAIDIWSSRKITLNTAATWVAGNFNTAVHFDATASSYATLPAGVVSTLTDFTISAWVKLDALASYSRIFDFGSGTTNYMTLAPKGGSGFPIFQFKSGSGAAQAINGTAAIPTGTWTHFAVTQSGSVAILYVNGVEVGRNSAMTLNPSSLGNTTLNYIGKSQFSTDPILNGAVDDFRIYSKALTAAEINVLKNIQNQTITFNALAQETVGNADVDPGATASSGLAMSYTSSDTTIAKIINGKIHAKAAGSVTITAVQAGNGFYAGTAKNQIVSIVGPPPIPVVTALSTTQVILSWGASTGATSYNVKRSTVNGGPYTTIASPTAATYTDAAVTKGSTYYYVVTSVNNLGESQASAPAIVFVGKALTGTLIGTSGSYGNNSATTIAAARDNNLNTFFDASVVTGAWVGIDLGTDSSAAVSYVGFAPRATYQSRMVNGVFQGANKADFSDAVTLTTVSTAPAYSVITTKTVSNTGTYRYLRYLGPTNGYCNIAEVQFWGQMKGNQTITFSAIPQKQMGDVDFDAGATASSGLPATYSSGNIAVATVVNNKIHLVGVGTATITASQVGNSNYAIAPTASQILTVVADHTAPVITPVSGTVTLALDASGSKTVSQASVVASVVDNYTASPTVTLSPESFTCATTGNQTVTITATDANGNTSTATKAVTVVDNIAPTVKTQNITANLDATGKATITEAQINNGSTDNCSIAAYALDKKTFDSSNIGLNIVTLTVTDASGNASAGTAIVTVQDSIAPSVVTRSVTANLDATGTAVVTEAQINNGSTDNSLIATYALDQNTFDCSNIGANTVTLTVTDVSGNAASGTAVVTVKDTIAPIVATRNIIANLDATGKATITEAQINNGSTDNCSIATYALDKKVFDCSNVGANTVTLTVTDGSGNASIGTAIVTVKDTVSPIVVTQNIAVTLDTTGRATITEAQINNGSTDNCSIATYTLNKKVFDSSNVGQNTVTLTVTDVNGNASTGTATVTVNKLNQAISFNAIPQKSITDPDFDGAATSSSGLAITYTTGDNTVATIVNGKVHITGAGSTVVTASQTGNPTYLAAASVSQSLTVNKLAQSITFNALPNKRPGDADVTLSATASSGLAVTYTSSNTNVAAIVNGALHITGIGSSVITATLDGNSTYSTATATQTFTVIPINLQVQYQDGDAGQLTNNVIRPYLKIVNADSVGVAYNQITMRYWFTPENYAGMNTWMDYALLGNSNVSMRYVALAQPSNGALGYMEYSFPLSGNLSAGSNTGPIQSHFANQDWSNFSESDDYSYQNSTSNYTSNNHITLYRNGMLIWGTEPATVSPATSLSVSYQNQNLSASGNTISTYLSINNTGNQPVAYGDVAVRYWFTEEGTQSLNYWIDYAKKGSNNISGKFIALSPVRNGADHYFEITLNASAGVLYPLSNSGNIQYRIAKSDWSNFNEANDYSYAAKDVMQGNSKITVYYKGVLVYGTEPAAMSANSITAGAGDIALKLPPTVDINKPLSDRLIIYPNPVADSRFSVKLTSDLLDQTITVKIRDAYGKMMQNSAFKAEGDTLKVPLSGSYPPGVYFVQFNSLPSIRIMINL